MILNKFTRLQHSQFFLDCSNGLLHFQIPHLDEPYAPDAMTDPEVPEQEEAQTGGKKKVILGKSVRWSCFWVFCTTRTHHKSTVE
jgi:hypothetical protein